MNIDRPDIRAYDGYRPYIRDMIEWKIASYKGYSRRSFARDAGLGSHSHVTKVLEGGRRLTEDFAARYASALGLDMSERNHFMEMIRNEESSELAWDDVDPITFSLEILTLCLSRVPGLTLDGDSLSKQVRGLVTAGEFEVAIKKLMSRELLVHDGGKLVPNESLNAHTILSEDRDMVEKMNVSQARLISRVVADRHIHNQFRGNMFWASPTEHKALAEAIDDVIRKHLAERDPKAADKRLVYAYTNVAMISDSPKLT